MPLAPGRRLLALLFSISFLAVAWAGLVQPSTPEIATEFGAGGTARGAIIGVTSLFAFIFAPLAGFFADRYGRRQILVGGLVFFALSGLITATAPSLEIFMVGRAVLGIGNAGLIALAITSISDLFDPKDALRLVGYNGTAIALGLIIHPLLGGWIAETWDWRFAVALQLAALPLAALVWFLIPEVKLPEPQSLSAQFGRAVKMVRSPVVLRSSVLFFGAFFMIFGLEVTLIPQYLVEEFAASETERAGFFVVVAAGIGIASLFLGKLQNRFGPGKVYSTGVILFVVFAATVGVAQSFILVLAAALVHGMAEGFTIQSLQVELAVSVPASAKAIAITIMLSGGRLGQFAGSFLFGYLDTLTSQRSLFFVGIGFYSLLFIANLLLRADSRVVVR